MIWLSPVLSRLLPKSSSSKLGMLINWSYSTDNILFEPELMMEIHKTRTLSLEKLVFEMSRMIR